MIYSVFQVIGIRVSASRIYDYIRTDKTAHAKFLKEIGNPEYVNIQQYDSIILQRVADELFEPNIDVFKVTSDRDNSNDLVIGRIVSRTYCCNPCNDPNIKIDINSIVEMSKDVSKYFLSVGFVEPVNFYTTQHGYN